MPHIVIVAWHFYQSKISILHGLNLVQFFNMIVARLSQLLTKKKLQHGPDECLLSTLEACAINVWPNVVRLLFTPNYS